MIDGHFKTRLDRVWNYLARGIVKAGISANQVTLAGLIFMLLVCLVYPFWQNQVGFALVILFFFAFDSLDGAVARITNTCSDFGGYLDAMVDRYQEIAVYAALAYTHDCWPAAFFVISGSLLVSYAKARTAVEKPIHNDTWPDLMERMERILFLCVGLLLSSVLTVPDDWPVSYMTGLLLLIGVLTHFTAIQRFFRAKRILQEK
ncbi:MAG: archaetidylinositol phosphate synthase [Paraglaciecola sp.]|jgi:archaetidylinositol phosphate synthase